MTGTPTWQALCDALRDARRGHLSAITAVDAARDALRQADARLSDAHHAEEDARDALDRFIDTQVSA